jgi:hypothetical protein
VESLACPKFQQLPCDLSGQWVLDSNLIQLKSSRELGRSGVSFHLVSWHPLVHNPGERAVPQKKPPTDTERLVYCNGYFRTKVLCQDERENVS